VHMFQRRTFGTSLDHISEEVASRSGAPKALTTAMVSMV